MDRSGVVRVYLETEKQKAATCAFKESPGVQAKTEEVICQVTHSPQNYQCVKEGRIIPAKDMESFTEHFVRKA